MKHKEYWINVYNNGQWYHYAKHSTFQGASLFQTVGLLYRIHVIMKA